MGVLKARGDRAGAGQGQERGEFAQYQQQLDTRLAHDQAVREVAAQRSDAQLKIADAAIKKAQAEVESARLSYESEIGGVNTTVAQVQAALAQARLLKYHAVALEDGYDLQVRLGRWRAITAGCVLCRVTATCSPTYYQRPSNT